MFVDSCSEVIMHPLQSRGCMVSLNIAQLLWVTLQFYLVLLLRLFNHHRFNSNTFNGNSNGILDIKVSSYELGLGELHILY